MNILIFGATGFIGKALVRFLKSQNYKVLVVSRNIKKAQKLFYNQADVLVWDYSDLNRLSELLNQSDVVVNLAGAGIAGKYWTKKYKQKILNSRVNLSKKISEALVQTSNKPKQIIQSSAIGFYGYDCSEKCTELSAKGNGFLSDVCEGWEKALTINDLQVKKVIVRTGVVLGKDGGLFPKLVMPIKLFVGSNFGKGNNIISWIHIQDMVRAIEYMITHNEEGIFNFTSPNPVKSKELNYEIAQQLNRPVWMRIPVVIIRFLLGEMADELLLANQHVIPGQLIKTGYKFLYPELNKALDDLLTHSY